MKLAACLMLAALTAVVACDDKKNDGTSTTSAMGDKGQADNTKRNDLDKNGATVTPMDQGNGKADIDTTANIRKAVMSADSLSTDAKNCKIVTNGGVVTLRGPVASQAEKTEIENRARQNAGSNRVVNELTIAP